MFNYYDAHSQYAGRKDPHIGRKLRSSIYMKYDEARDCFVLRELGSKWEKGSDVSYVLAPKERWSFGLFAEVYRDRIVVISPIHNTPMAALFHLASFAPTSNRFEGRRWVHREQVIHGDAPIVIKDGKISCLIPPRVRQLNAEPLKELNELIKRVRRYLKVRAKLGAFAALTEADLAAHAPAMTKWVALDNPRVCYDALAAVDPKSLSSFYRLFWLCDPRHYWSNAQIGELNWSVAFETFIKSKRELLRRYVGAVEYVSG